MKNISSLKMGLYVFLRILFGSFIALTISLSVMLMLNNAFGRTVSQILNFSATFSLVYLKVWQVGYADRNRVKSEYSKEDKFKGIKGGIIGTLPYLIPSVLLILSKMGFLGSKMMYIFRLLNPVFMPIYYTMFPPTLFISEIGWGSVLLTLLLPFIFALIAGIGYYMGYSDILLTGNLRKPNLE